MTTYSEEFQEFNQKDLDTLLSMSEVYLLEVFGINLDRLPDSPDVLQNIRENAAEGYPLDRVLINTLEG